jgi:HEAT repeat protein
MKTKRKNMKIKISIVLILLISILLVSGCTEQKSIDSSNSRPLVTQTPNTSALENIKNLEKIGDNNSIELLISMFEDKDEQIQQSSMIALLNIGEPAVEPLIQALKSQKPDTRLCAVIVLGKMGDKRAIEPVKQLLNDTDEHIQTGARDAYNELMKIK